MGGTWHTVGGNTGYGEKVFPNKKVGHVLAYPQPVPGRTRPTYKHWRASLDGIPCGSATNFLDAQVLVEERYVERYGG